ncbi:MAG TPA: hypothetical protein VGD16_05450 [Enterovirga sp.]|jgi:hypothetical protein
MRAISTLLGLFVVVAGSSLAHAQATRTWVSGVGDDANPCSRTAPCKTFAGAISKTAIAGEINCIDSGGFGAVTITKSMAIVCDNVEAGIAATGTNGINVNGAGIVVFLSGLDIEGYGTGINGINFIQGATLNVKNTILRGFQASNGTGLKVAPASGTSEVFLENLTVSENGTAADGFGVQIAPTGSGSVTGVLDRVTVKNSGAGLRADAAGSTGTVSLVVRSSTAVGNTRAGIAAAKNSTVLVDGGTVSGNGTGVITQDVGSALLLTRTAVFFNTNGLTVTGGPISSYADNEINNNTNDGPTPTPIAHK